MMLTVKIFRNKNTRDLPLPEYKSKGASGMDLPAAVEAPVTIKPGEYSIIPTGIYLEIPEGYEGQVRPRSGLAAKYGVTILNTPGTIDSDYRGEIMVILINLGKESYVVERGDRIAQLVISKHESVSFIPVFSLEATDRGEGGFGHTGI
ncbi:MAG: Deoxyuridine 5'-triphosphate nucleotidohydrolase [Firmicutes bacterium]|nr:Deoxyuridine 5'-triphosphate nucleotidohydrolase [Bacillota bacterium]MDI6704729.1 dUTP diphosphatase [Bacillota bacterium]